MGWSLTDVPDLWEVSERETGVVLDVPGAMAARGSGQSRP